MVGAPENPGNGAPGSTDFVTLYLAALILKCAGFDAEAAARALNEIYGVEVEPSRVEEWFSTVPETVRRKRALLNFLETLSRDRLWALRYVGGAIVGDGDEDGKLRVKDWLFIDAYAKALAILTGEPHVKIRRTKDGRYYTRCFHLARYIRDGLWKTLAYLDTRDEIKHFLAGLLDAEGSLSPHIHKKYKSLNIQLSFGNTNFELVKFVMELLKQMRLSPYLHVKQRNPHILQSVNGRKLVIPKKTVYEINVRVPFSKVMVLAKVGFRCSREARLFAFFISVKDLPPRLRYEAFTKNWRKVGKMWEPIPAPARKRPRRSRGQRGASTHRRRTHIVQCPVCKQAGTFTLHGEVAGGRMLVQVRIHHGSGVCTLNIAEREIRQGEKPTMLVKCSKCGKPGYVYAFTHDFMWRKRYRYLRVGVCHHLDARRTKTCLLMTLHLLDEAASTAANTEQPAPTLTEPRAS